jgi:serine/threonine protein phosphatase PrpC
MVVEETIYISNVGDSRAILSGCGGTKIYSLSKDHKPGEAGELKRIADSGGKLY